MSEPQVGRPGFGRRLRDALDQYGPLCVGIDPHEALLRAWGMDATPAGAREFGLRTVEAAAGRVGVVKPQAAFYERYGAAGFAALEEVIAAARAAGLIVIADAKRGDIGSTAEQYAKEAFERYGADAVTLSPFMGFDSVQPYLKYEGKGAFLLCRTSNPGGDDLQNQRLASVPGEPLLYEHIAALAQGPWNLNGQLGLVVGATYPDELRQVRQAVVVEVGGVDREVGVGRECDGGLVSVPNGVDDSGEPSPDRAHVGVRVGRDRGEHRVAENDRPVLVPHAPTRCEPGEREDSRRNSRVVLVVLGCGGAC